MNEKDLKLSLTTAVLVEFVTFAVLLTAIVVVFVGVWVVGFKILSWL
jgi:hypothetical protein